MRDVIHFISEHLSEYIERVTEHLVRMKVPANAGSSREAIKDIVERPFRILVRDLEIGTVEGYAAYFADVGIQRAQHGGWIGDLQQGLLFMLAVITEHVGVAFSHDISALLWWERQRYELASAALTNLSSLFFKAREAVIAEQNAEIRKLSAPIIPVARRVLVLPLVGAIDEERVQQITTALLERINREQAAVVIMDVTGLPTVNTAVAGALGRISAAVRLLGAHAILVGVNPELARTIVAAGLSLEGITTLADLESGVEYALRLTADTRSDAVVRGATRSAVPAHR